ncbi:MAG: thiamine pyrophosphate-dependent enzyme [Oscillospiraceae bacterium]|nr:thiamine pyrophosphate-dependent enzyme [Oscillospiraceae bacterium]
MPKIQVMDPKEIRKSGFITFSDIPVNQYKKTVKDEKEASQGAADSGFKDDDFVRIYKDMAIIREFESMLYSIKTTNVYNGVEYNNPGPAHLSLGQEASAVGQAYLLDENDFIFGSHRSHGEILAKGLSCIHKMDEKTLQGIMEEFFGGAILKVVEDKQKDVKELAVDFLVYGALAEIFARETGFNKGLGGSMHAFFTPFGIYPNNAIVGGSGTIAMGSALFKKVNKKKGIVISNIGDASMGCGPVWEALNMAAMDQYTQLWEEGYKGGLPIIFNFFNNLYGMGGQTIGETMGYNMLARVGAGVNPEQMYSERVDGFNPLAVIDAMRRKMELIKSGKAPVFLDTVTYRFTGHSPSDSGSYRTKEEVELWQEQDSLVVYGKELVDAGVCGQDRLDNIQAYVKDLMTKTCKLSIDDNLSPRIKPEEVGKLMFSNINIAKLEDLDPSSAPQSVDVLQTKEENPRVQQIAKKVRFAYDENGKPVSKIKQYQLRDGIFEAVLDKFYTDPTLVAYGEDNRDWGGAFAVYRGLTEALPYHRFFNSPISEAAIVGSAVGYALSGGRAIVELMYSDFIGRAGDEVFNQLSKWQSMSAGVLRMPVVLRVSVGSKYGAQHSQDWTSLIAHIPGLKCVFPATPYDAKGLMNSALSGTDPVVFFESQRIYDIGEQFVKTGVPEGYYEIPIGEPDVKVQGSDITILTIGATLYPALEAVKILKDNFGISAELIDARSIVPFNFDKVLESVKKTGCILLASDACERGSHIKDFAQTITELAFDYLDAPPVTVGSRNWITPAYELEDYFFPQPDRIIDAIHQKIMPLDGHVPKNNFTEIEQLRRSREGV